MLPKRRLLKSHLPVCAGTLLYFRNFGRLHSAEINGTGIVLNACKGGEQ
jgi:hypothetical protein